MRCLPDIGTKTTGQKLTEANHPQDLLAHRCRYIYERLRVVVAHYCVRFQTQSLSCLPCDRKFLCDEIGSRSNATLRDKS